MSKLSDFISIKHGFAFKGEFITTEENANCLITPVNFSIGGGFKSDKFKYYTGEIPEKYILQPNDLIVTMTDLSKQADTLGYPALVPNISGKKMLHNQRIGLVEFLNNELDKEYLYFLMRTKEYRHQILSTATGATVHHTSPSKILDFEFEKPDLQTQKLIAQYLMILEEKIQLNTQTNQTLEQIAQAIFKSWFVDFDPVRAKAAALSEGKSEYEANLAAMSVICGKDTSELNDTEYKALWQIAEAFPSELVANEEFGEVPKGWEIVGLSSLFEFIGGSQPPKSEHIYNEQEGYERFIQNRDYSNENHITYIPISKKNKRCNEKDILMDKYGEAGKVRFGIKGAYNVALAKIQPKAENLREFLRGYFMQDSVMTYLHMSSIASTRNSLNSSSFAGLNIVIPNDMILDRFEEVVSTHIDAILKLKTQNKMLAKTRDLLLPRLLSGELLNE